MFLICNIIFWIGKPCLGYPWYNSNNLPIDYWAASFSKEWGPRVYMGRGKTSPLNINYDIHLSTKLYVFLVSSLHMLGCPKMHCVSDCPARQVVQELHWSFIYNFWMPSNPLILRIIHHVDSNIGRFTIILIECIIGSIRFLTQPWCLNFIEFWLFTQNYF